MDVEASGAISIDAGAASNFNCSVGILTLGGVGVNIAGGNAEIDLTTTGDIDLNGDQVTIDGSTDVNIGTNAIWTDGTNVAIGAGSGSANWALQVVGLDTTNDTETVLLTNNDGTPHNAGIHVYHGDPVNNVTPQGVGDICLNTSSGTIHYNTTGAAAGWLAVGSATGNSLQLAYDAGQTIQLEGTSKGDMTIDTDDTVDVANFIVQNEAQTAQYLATDATNAQLELGHANITVGMIGKIDTDVTFETSGGAKTITTDGTNGLTIETSADAAITVDGATGVNIVGNAGQVDITTTGVVDINSGGASEWTNATGNLTLSTTTSGDLTVQSIDKLKLVGNGSGSAPLSGSYLVTDSENLTLATYTSGTLGIYGVAAVDVDGTAITVDASNGLSLDGTGAASNLSSTGQNLTVSTISSGTLAVDSAGALDMDAAAGFTLDGAGAASSITSDQQNLTISTNVSGTLAVTSAATLDLNGVAVTLDATSGFSIDGSGAPSNVSSTADNLTLSTITSGDLIVTVADGAANDLLLQAHGSVQIPFNADGADSDLIGFTATSVIGALNELKSEGSDVYVTVTGGEVGGIAVGDAVYLSTADGKAYFTDADAAASSVFLGVAVDAIAQDATGRVVVAGEVTSSTDFAAMANGDVLYLDTTTAGGLVKDVSGYTGGDTVLRVGIVSDQANDKFVIQVGMPVLL